LIVLWTLIPMVHRSTGRGAVYQRPNLLELMDGSTSSCVATDYHSLTYLNYDALDEVHAL
jgi:hypothetical protein